MSERASRSHEVEELHQDIAALAAELRSPQPSPVRVAMVPFALGAASALITFIAIGLLAKLL
ncbi:hypothetical protein D3C73_615890 [compost metagenome]